MAFFLITLLGSLIWAFVLFRTRAVWRLTEFIANVGGPELRSKLDEQEMTAAYRLFAGIGFALCTFLAVLSGLALLA